MYGFVVAMLNIGKNLIPGVGVLGIVQVKDVHDYPVDDLGLDIHLGWKAVNFLSLLSSSDQRFD
jgi:hypothetical protein